MIGDDTAVSLALRLGIDEADHRQAALDAVSEAVITMFALRAKADIYQVRIDCRLAAAAALGATIEDLAAAAAMSPAEVRSRLEAARNRPRPAVRTGPGSTARPGGSPGLT